MSDLRGHRRNLPLRRTILLGLGPLISLWALGTQLGMGPSVPEPAQTSQQSVTAKFDRLLQPMVSFLMLTAEHGSQVRPDERWTPQSTMALEALQATPLGGSIWLVRNPIATDRLARRHQQSTLRC